MSRSVTLASLFLCVMAILPLEAEEHIESAADEKTQRHLGRNVKLEFKAVPLEKGDKGIYLVTASPNYESIVKLHGDDTALLFAVTGTLELLPKDRIYVRYTVHARIGDRKGEAEFEVASGVILKPGEEVGVSGLGEKTLMIRASFIGE